MYASYFDYPCTNLLNLPETYSGGHGAWAPSKIVTKLLFQFFNINKYLNYFCKIPIKKKPPSIR